MKDCLKASISIPKLVEPVLVNGERLCDGAVADNTPITPLFNHELDLIISVQFDAHMPNLSEISTGQAVCPVLFLNLHNGSAFKDSFDLECSRVNGMINYGYDVSDDILTLIESRYCHGTYERFIRLISYCNSQLKESRRSGDYIVRKINKVSNILH
jgi:predicted acylesterase/phospholipase RssA